MPVPHKPIGRGSSARRARDRAAKLVHYVVVPVLVTGFASLTGRGSATFLQTALSFLLLQIAWGSWVAWKDKPASDKHFPLFPILAGMFWLAYGLPLFWSQPESWNVAGGFVSSEGVTRAQLLALLGIASLYCGMRLGVGQRMPQAKTFDLRDSPVSPKYILALMVFGVALRYIPTIAGLFGASLRQVFMILRNTLPLVAYAILLRRSLMRRVPFYEWASLVLFVVGTFVFGLASGWVGTGAAIIMVTGCVLLDTRSAIPKSLVAAVFLYIIFLQPAKEEYRAAIWSNSNAQADEMTRASTWLSMSRQHWYEAWVASDPEAMRRQLYGSMNRFSLLQQTANVMDVTPSIIPYQRWTMYTYMAYTLVPRALWKEKPTVNDANRLYQVTYGITSERALEGVSISVGVLTESYISFGWLGAFVVMTVVGVVLDCVASFLLARNAGVLMKGLGMALLPGFVSMESQMAQYLGGLAQQVFLTIVVMAPVMVVRRRSPVPTGMQHFVPAGAGPIRRSRIPAMHLPGRAAPAADRT